MPGTPANTVIYHNPRCSKSRQTLSLLEDNGIQATVVEYLKTPPGHEELSDILAQLNMEPRQLMRTKEELYKKLGLDNPELGREVLIQAMVDNPSLIERPIVLSNERAALGRPPENILQII
jgi:arsenate reductase